MELPDDAKIEAEEEEQKRQDKQQNKIDDMESKIKQFSLNLDNDSKLREIQDKMEHKLNMVKEAVQKDNDSLAQRRINALEKIIEEYNNG